MEFHLGGIAVGLTILGLVLGCESEKKATGPVDNEYPVVGTWKGELMPGTDSAFQLEVKIALDKSYSFTGSKTLGSVSFPVMEYSGDWSLNQNQFIATHKSCKQLNMAKGELDSIPCVKADTVTVDIVGEKWNAKFLNLAVELTRAN